MNPTDFINHYAWQIYIGLAIIGLAIIVAFACGLAIGRRMGRLETPHIYKRALDRVSLQVVRWRERWRAEVRAREVVEERHARLRGALKVYEEEAV